MPLPVLQSSRVTVMIKPVGALCNLDCHYCYYLPTKTIYDGREHRMSLATLESVFAGALPHFDDEVTIAWQGGEPTLAGLAFFEKALEFQSRHARAGQRVSHALQTNGVLLDDRWCRFFREHKFLVGLSVDGPARFHDRYRRDNGGRPTSEQVRQALRLLQHHAVDYNILCVLNDVNVHHGKEVFRYLLNAGSRWVQFIPAVEWEVAADAATNRLAPYAPAPEAYGRFLCEVFDLWFERYRKRVSVRLFDAVLNKLVLGATPLCILDGSCHNQLTIEHDGAVFGCDHFVERRWQLARIGEPGWRNRIRVDGGADAGLTIHGRGYEKLPTHGGRDIGVVEDVPQAAVVASSTGLDGGWLGRTDDQRLGVFAARKQHLPDKCRACTWKPYCHGGCPKHRPGGGEVPEPTVLCEGYMMFYGHAMPRLQWLADFLRRGEQPPDPEPVQTPAASVRGGGRDSGVPRPAGATTTVRRRAATGGRVGRNAPCPCGSGLKHKHCHGQS